MSLYFRQLPVGPMQNFAYLVGDEKTRKCWVVDPAWEGKKIRKTAEKDGYAVAGLLLTHAHYDHCNAVEELLSPKDLPLYVHKDEVAALQKYADTGIFGPLPVPRLAPVSSGDKISLGDVALSFLHTPGHSPGSQCLLLDDRVLSGDTLFIGACGRSDLPGGDPRRLYDSLYRTLAALPGHLMLFPGHDYSPSDTASTLEKERRTNRALQAKSTADFLAWLGR
ncbi:MAG TPA: MBL fold metallo-hydrolase [Elusimicrobiota bacterium]|nr:MBL fold metallo-hydrolase [Elusimicrobiota bacterium]